MNYNKLRRCCALALLPTLCAAYLFVPLPRSLCRPGADSLIAHGCGIIDGHPYTNSREAVLRSVADGFRQIEADLTFLADSSVVCLHDAALLASMTGGAVRELPADSASFTALRFYGRYTPLTLPALADLQRRYGFRIVTDKLSQPSVLARHLSAISRSVSVEAFSLSDYAELDRLGFTPMLSIRCSLRAYVSACIASRRRIAFITTSVHSPADFITLRLLKRLFAVKVAVYSPLAPDLLMQHLGSDFDFLYTDKR